MRMRLQKYLADAGIDSRRKCEDLIAQGLVFVNGAPAELGCVVDPEQDIVVYAGKRVASAQERTVLAFNKPQCVVSTMRDPEGRRTVADYFADFPERLYPVGRLDYDSEGLLIMTNDGALAYRMTHPKFTVEKTYLVHCDGRADHDGAQCARTWRDACRWLDRTRPHWRDQKPKVREYVL